MPLNCATAAAAARAASSAGPPSATTADRPTRTSAELRGIDEVLEEGCGGRVGVPVRLEGKTKPPPNPCPCPPPAGEATTPPLLSPLPAASDGSSVPLGIRRSAEAVEAERDDVPTTGPIAAASAAEPSTDAPPGPHTPAKDFGRSGEALPEGADSAASLGRPTPDPHVHPPRANSSAVALDAFACVMALPLWLLLVPPLATAAARATAAVAAAVLGAPRLVEA